MEPPGDVRGEVTRIFARAVDGEADALDEALPLIYEELRGIARAYMLRERPGHTLQPTALAHEAFLTLRERTHVRWRSRAHFLAAAAQSMRRILVDHARARLAAKRGGGRERVPLEEVETASDDSWADVLSLDRALGRLATADERKARVVEMLFFSGMTPPEAAEVLDVSRRTVERDWRYARAWLLREIAGTAGGEGAR
jgi:RNA polymerase sigma factor (TIGR02999 family)